MRAAGDFPRLVAGLAVQLELVLELLPPVVPPLGPSVERHKRKTKLIFSLILTPRVNSLNLIVWTEKLINILKINGCDY